MPEVIMPKMGDAMEEGTLLQWLKQDGETVKSGDVIAEIETDKSNVEIEAEDAGVLRIQAQPGAVVPVGNVIALIGDDVKASGGNGQAAPAAPAPSLNRQRRFAGFCRRRAGSGPRRDTPGFPIPARADAAAESAAAIEKPCEPAPARIFSSCVYR